MPLHYETSAGLPTRALILSQLNEKLIECQELSAMYAHLLNTEDNHMDRLLAKGWLGMSELFRQVQFKITQLAQGKLN